MDDDEFLDLWRTGQVRVICPACDCDEESE